MNAEDTVLTCSRLTSGLTRPGSSLLWVQGPLLLLCGEFIKIALSLLVVSKVYLICNAAVKHPASEPCIFYWILKLSKGSTGLNFVMFRMMYNTLFWCSSLYDLYEWTVSDTQTHHTTFKHNSALRDWRSIVHTDSSSSPQVWVVLSVESRGSVQRVLQQISLLKSRAAITLCCQSRKH